MAVAIQMGASAAVAAPTAGLIIEPRHGQPTDWVNATLHTPTSRPQICPDDIEVAFSFDSVLVRRVVLDADCIATVRFRPPSRHRDPGRHVVRAEITHTSVMLVAAYTIDPTSTGEAPELPSGEPSVVPGGGSDIPMDAPSADGAADSPQAPPQIADAPIGGGPVSDPQARRSSAHVWPFILGGGLIVAGVTVLCVLVVDTRRAT
jgi:hypothetical protein